MENTIHKNSKVTIASQTQGAEQSQSNEKKLALGILLKDLEQKLSKASTELVGRESEIYQDINGKLNQYAKEARAKTSEASSKGTKVNIFSKVAIGLAAVGLGAALLPMGAAAMGFTSASLAAGSLAGNTLAAFSLLGPAATIASGGISVKCAQLEVNIAKLKKESGEYTVKTDMATETMSRMNKDIET